ncbi:hypothetical protein DIPPA_30594 [Diplonema papillatum]|nr:hypothetical protein DIPPA_30594 [Diplonema papillatum]
MSNAARFGPLAVFIQDVRTCVNMALHARVGCSLQEAGVASRAFGHAVESRSGEKLEGEVTVLNRFHCVYQRLGEVYIVGVCSPSVHPQPTALLVKRVSLLVKNLCGRSKEVSTAALKKKCGDLFLALEEALHAGASSDDQNSFTSGALGGRRESAVAFVHRGSISAALSHSPPSPGIPVSPSKHGSAAEPPSVDHDIALQLKLQHFSVEWSAEGDTKVSTAPSPFASALFTPDGHRMTDMTASSIRHVTPASRAPARTSLDFLSSSTNMLENAANRGLEASRSVRKQASPFDFLDGSSIAQSPEPPSPQKAGQTAPAPAAPLKSASGTGDMSLEDMLLSSPIPAQKPPSQPSTVQPNSVKNARCPLDSNATTPSLFPSNQTTTHPPTSLFTPPAPVQPPREADLSLLAQETVNMTLQGPQGVVSSWNAVGELLCLGRGRILTTPPAPDDPPHTTDTIFIKIEALRGADVVRANPTFCTLDSESPQTKVYIYKVVVRQCTEGSEGDASNRPAPVCLLKYRQQVGDAPVIPLKARVTWDVLGGGHAGGDGQDHVLDQVVLQWARNPYLPVTKLSFEVPASTAQCTPSKHQCKPPGLWDPRNAVLTWHAIEAGDSKLPSQLQALFRNEPRNRAGLTEQLKAEHAAGKQPLRVIMEGTGTVSGATMTLFADASCCVPAILTGGVKFKFASGKSFFVHK